MQEFGLYIDDSGSPTINEKDRCSHFAFGGILIKHQDSTIIDRRVKRFKNEWNIPLHVPLHGSEIRSMKKRFAWLGKLGESDRLRFYQELTEMITSSPIIIHACVISHSGYRQRYPEPSESNSQDIMKTAFSLLVERAVKFVAKQDGKMMVYYEKMGKKEDKAIKSCFRALRGGEHLLSGEHITLLSQELSLRLSGIQDKAKEYPELQIADLCLYPIARIKEQPNNRAYQAMCERKLLVDYHLLPEEQETMGIKYLYFD